MKRKIPHYEVTPQTPCPYCGSIKTQMTDWSKAMCMLCLHKVPVIRRLIGYK